MKLKKCLSLLLCLCLCMGLFPTAALAAEEFTIDETGALIRYNGPGGDVVIPDGVTKIAHERGRYGRGAFQGCTNLTGVTIPDSVIEISEEAFDSCTNLTSVTIPDSVTTIGREAFSGCTSLTNVTIPGSVAIIDDYTFQNCTGLTNVIISDGVTKVGRYAFFSCTGLTSVTIPDSVTEIGIHAFSSCTSLTNITIPNSVTEISNGAFGGTALTSVTIPDSVTRIGDSAFGHCQGLTNVNMGNGVIEINYCAFDGCTGLTSVTFPDSVTQIGDHTFRDCTGLTSVTIPDGITEIGWGAFEGCTGLRTVAVPSTALIRPGAFPEMTEVTLRGHNFEIEDGVLKKYRGPGGDVAIPDGVTQIGSGAFSGCTSLTSVTIPDSVTEIGQSAFANCKSLTGVTFGSGVTKIGDAAFKDCTGLTSVTIPDSVTEIGQYAFEGCTNLATATIPGTAESGWSAFPNTTKITMSNHSFTIENGVLSNYRGPGGNVVIPDSVTQIGNHAFKDCTGLTKVTIPDSVTQIGDNAFEGCTGLTRVTFGSGVTKIGYAAFKDCTGLTSVTIPNSVTTISSNAFYGCTNLATATIPGTAESWNAFPDTTKITLANHGFTIKNGVLLGYNGPGGAVVIPDSATKISQEVFSHCTSLTGVTIPDSVTTIGDSAFSGCANLTRVTFGRGVTEIGNYAFSGCTGLTSVTIPNSVTQIGNRAFEGCTGLTGVTFGSGVAEIGGDAFAYCTGLTSVALPDSVTKIDWEAFAYCDNLTSVTIGSGIREIDARAFSYCPNLTSFTVSSRARLKEIHLDYGCPKLARVTLPDSVERLSITSDALREFVIPAGMTEWPDMKCPRITKLTFPKNNWVFKGISRAEFIKRITPSSYGFGYPALNEIVNCPNEFLDDLIVDNAALRDKWTDPRSAIVPQSARITKLSNEITAGCTTEYDKAKAISEWVSTHIKYDDDYYYEGLKDYSDVPFNPEEILDKGQAVCAGYARLTQALLAAQNIPCLYVLGWTKSGYHAWNLAFIDGEYLWIDNTWHGIDGGNYFGLGIYAISKDHTSVSGAAFNGVKGPGTTVSISETEAGRLEINPSWLDLGTVREGYQQSAAQTITVRNTGTKAVTLTQPTAVNFEVGRLSRTTLNAGESATFTVRPKAGLKANGTAGRSYEETLTVQGDNGFTVQLELTFKVEPAAALAGVSDWAQPYVAQAIELGILPQDLQSLYDQATTRQEFCVLADNLYLALMGHYPNSGERVSFTDTSDKYVLDMARAKVVSGVGGGRFEPDRSLEREEAATLLSQFALAVNKPLASYNATFADKAEVSDWALPFVGAMQNCGVMKGVGGNRFEPHGDYTREQSVVTIMLMYELLK